jgi:hypothetical protein
MPAKDSLSRKISRVKHSIAASDDMNLNKYMNNESLRGSSMVLCCNSALSFIHFFSYVNTKHPKIPLSAHFQTMGPKQLTLLLHIKAAVVVSFC